MGRRHDFHHTTTRKKFRRKVFILETLSLASTTSIVWYRRTTRTRRKTIFCGVGHKAEACDARCGAHVKRSRLQKKNNQKKMAGRTMLPKIAVSKNTDGTESGYQELN